MDAGAKIKHALICQAASHIVTVSMITDQRQKLAEQPASRVPATAFETRWAAF
jgi:hypothetical protein